MLTYFLATVALVHF